MAGVFSQHICLTLPPPCPMVQRCWRPTRRAIPRPEIHRIPPPDQTHTWSSGGDRDAPFNLGRSHQLQCRCLCVPWSECSANGGPSTESKRPDATLVGIKLLRFRVPCVGTDGLLATLAHSPPRCCELRAPSDILPDFVRPDHGTRAESSRRDDGHLARIMRFLGGCSTSAMAARPIPSPLIPAATYKCARLQCLDIVVCPDPDF